MVDPDARATAQLNPTRLAWLREIGIDKNLLGRFALSGLDTVSTTEHHKVERPAVSARPASAAVSTKILLDVGVMEGALPHDLASLEAVIAICQACPLHSGRSQTVFGSGATESVTWMIIGEAPGEQDDRVGLPFQGSAGVLLHAMLAAVGLKPDASVFFTNLVKCRPLGNRPPEPDEIAACLPYLRRQIALLNPRRILTLGRLAAQTLLNDESDFEQLRGRVHGLRSETGAEIPLVATYHPAFLLSRPQYKANAWHDLNLARAALDD
jgi:DNA polymerase